MHTFYLMLILLVKIWDVKLVLWVFCEGDRCVNNNGIIVKSARPHVTGILIGMPLSSLQRHTHTAVTARHQHPRYPMVILVAKKQE